jgi:hypothetical protein
VLPYGRLELHTFAKDSLDGSADIEAAVILRRYGRLGEIPVAENECGRPDRTKVRSQPGEVPVETKAFLKVN